MKTQPPPLKIGTPCPKRWEDMTGNAQRRFCEHCQLHVHNLSAMPERRRAKFVRETQGRACIAYVQGLGGTMVTEGRLTRFLRPFRPLQAAGIALLAAILPFWFSSCATRRTTYVKGKPATIDQKRGENDRPPLLLGAVAYPKNKPPHPDITVGVPLPPDSRN